MAEHICHSFRSLVRPHDYHPSGLRMDGQGRTERVIERGRCLRTILRAVCGEGGGVRRGPRVTTAFGPQRELPLARLVIHGQASAQNSVGERGKVQTRSGILAYFFTRHHWLWKTVELHIPGARHEEADARKGGRYSPVHRARNHAALEHIDVVVGHGRSGVPLSSTRLHQ